MKKVTRTAKEREIQKHVELARHLRALESKEHALSRRRATSVMQKHAKGKVADPNEVRRGEVTDTGHEVVTLPATLDLVSHFEETAAVVRAIRRITLREKRSLLLDFTNVRSVKPSALLLLLAEIHRGRLIHGRSRLTGTYPKDPRIERMLDAIGFFKLLGVKSRVINTIRKFPMEYVGFHSDIREVKGTVRRFRESLLGTTILMSTQARIRLYRAVSEAMLNVGHHAYPVGTSRTHPERGRWWLTGHVNKKTGELTVMFCDLGVGIAKRHSPKFKL